MNLRDLKLKMDLRRSNIRMGIAFMEKWRKENLKGKAVLLRGLLLLISIKANGKRGRKMGRVCFNSVLRMKKAILVLIEQA